MFMLLKRIFVRLKEKSFMREKLASEIQGNRE